MNQKHGEAAAEDTPESDSCSTENGTEPSTFADTFHPIEIIGEPLSATIIRDRQDGY
jgi:hypothetical protein